MRYGNLAQRRARSHLWRKQNAEKSFKLNKSPMSTMGKGICSFKTRLKRNKTNIIQNELSTFEEEITENNYRRTQIQQKKRQQKNNLVLVGYWIIFWHDWLLRTLDGLAEGRADGVQIFNTEVLQFSALQMPPLDNRITTGCSLEGF